MKPKSKFKQTEIGMIPEDWEVKSISILATIKSGKRLPKGRNIVEYNTGFPYIRIRDLQNMSVNVPEVKFLEPDVQSIIKKYIITENDVYISIVGTIGLVGTIPRKLNNANLTENCARLTKLNVNRDYLKYFLNSKFGQDQIKSLTVGTTQGKLALSRIAKILVALPLDEEQSSIAKILSSLDSKIELNQEMNKTLEAIGQAIFRRWFMDFEFPNEKGKPYTSSGGEMVESELGEIPKGWKIERYEDLVTVSTGKGLKRDEFIENGEFPVIGANGELGRTNNYLFDEKLILTGRVGTLGTVYLIRNKVWISDNVLISKPISEEKYYYAYFTIRTFDFKSMNRGSTQPLITQTDLKNKIIIVPDTKTLSRFHSICLNLFEKIYQNESQIVRLSQIRDSLLPRLMSGKIRVPVEVRT